MRRDDVSDLDRFSVRDEATSIIAASAPWLDFASVKKERRGSLIGYVASAGYHGRVRQSKIMQRLKRPKLYRWALLAAQDMLSCEQNLDSFIDLPTTLIPRESNKARMKKRKKAVKKMRKMRRKTIEARPASVLRKPACVASLSRAGGPMGATERLA